MMTQTAAKQKILSQSPEQTAKIGERLSKALKPGDIICLFGDLGTGKTTFIKGVAKGLGLTASKVNSPTFVLMNAYEGRLPLFHFDLYRLENITEIGLIGYDEFLYDNGVAVIEWADRMGTILPKEHLKVELKHKGPQEREVCVTARGARYDKAMKKLEAR